MMAPVRFIINTAVTLLVITSRNCIPLCHCLSSVVTPPTLRKQTARAPTWTDLHRRILCTETGGQLAKEAELRQQGRGPPHVHATLRLFDDNQQKDKHNDKEVPVEVTFYRDAAAWCPYCQKVWLALEEKRIPYQVKTVPLNAYGDKPAWFTRLVDGGKLPAMAMNGELMTESLDIIQRLEDDDFPRQSSLRLIPIPGTLDAKMANDLMQLEKQLQSDWFSLVFYPVTGTALVEARAAFLTTLAQVDDALGINPEPWFLGGVAPSLVDIQFVTSIERIYASVLYFKGMELQNTGTFRNLDRWLEAWNERPSYRATKSDTYTLIKSIPSQNGPGYSIPEAKEIANQICGLNHAWDVSRMLVADDDEKQEKQQRYQHEAAFCVIANHEAIVSFATRGAGEPGRPSFHAELADPYSEPNDDFFDAVDICLRHVTETLLHGNCRSDKVELPAILDMAGHAGDGTLRLNWYEYPDEENDVDNSGRGVYWWNEETGDVTWTAPTTQLDTCLAYLRDRIGVPRDMSAGAAMQLRAHLNWAIELLNRRPFDHEEESKTGDVFEASK